MGIGLSCFNQTLSNWILKRVIYSVRPFNSLGFEFGLKNIDLYFRAVRTGVGENVVLKPYVRFK